MSKKYYRQTPSQQTNKIRYTSLHEQVSTADVNQRRFYRIYEKEATKPKNEQNPNLLAELKEIYEYWRERFLRLARKERVYAHLNMLS